MIIKRLTTKFGGRSCTGLILRATSPHRRMKFKRKGGIAMVLVIFVGGIFLGFSLGCATMALVEAKGLRLQSEETQENGGNHPLAYSPIRKFSPSLRARPQVSGVLLTSGLERGGGPRLGGRA
jgi:hypothetical protein